ncbi:formate/nitrite transporter family protein [Microbulbifer sp. CnH-101-G]|uniref:formate/nitrite transporter family protein n=1 Tax=Microbulbifer sp. CnH-101-G TaxID=3243393 RepID=UPI0040392AE0
MSIDSDKPKSERAVLREQMDASLHEYERESRSLLLSSVAAGLEIGFSFFLMMALFSSFYGELGKPALHLVLSLSYPVGFILVIIGRTDLFTEHTTLAILPVVDGRQRLRDLGRIWGLIYLGNMIGAFIFALMLVSYALVSQNITQEGFDYYGQKLIDDSNVALFLGAILAGWLMGLLGWLVSSSTDTIGRITVIAIVTFVIGLGSLPHCIAGAVAIFSAWIGGEGVVDWLELLRFQVIATLGNTFGGAVFVGLLKYGYITNNLP